MSTVLPSKTVWIQAGDSGFRLPRETLPADLAEWWVQFGKAQGVSEVTMHDGACRLGVALQIGGGTCTCTPRRIDLGPRKETGQQAEGE